ncbi:hypothetical protein FE783_36905 [Paenibacillus mesophilus]|uniref:hypothetical protein n=1 Tax=Paenibacillus mesophilus TaxID=2582849 RepID=UPI00110D9239|nr:hypothetical protein [Paenibacillus mesophilus]TMV42795.1 hypothetical protein FE783_36905 [Paenibacillus mesophilus]
MTTCRYCKKGTLQLLSDCYKCNYCIKEFDIQTGKMIGWVTNSELANKEKTKREKAKGPEQLKYLRMLAMKKKV